MTDSEDNTGGDRRIAKGHAGRGTVSVDKRNAILRGLGPVISVLALPIFLSACVPPDPPKSLALQSAAVPRYATYRCDGDGEITLENFRTSVHVVDTRGVDVELPASPPNQTARYGQPGYALILERGTALWMVSGKRPINCKQESDPA
ncbi:MAG: hypothetical protein ACTHJY_06700 [Rhizobiaceae bacterium]